MTSYYVDWPSINQTRSNFSHNCIFRWPHSNLPLFTSGKALQAHTSYTFGLEVDDKIDVLTVKQLPVKSERNPYGVDAKELVDGVFNDLGQERISYGHWKHSLWRYPILMQQCQWWFPVSTRSKPDAPFSSLLK